MEPPSLELAQALDRLGLVKPADLPGVESLVRRISGGLPIYDGVWIDALVRRGRITPFQAARLEDRRHAELDVGGRFVLVRPRHRDPVMDLFDGRETATGRPVLVTRIPAGLCEDDPGPRLIRLGASVSHFRSPAFIDVVSPAVPGESLARFLIRRGRFPESVVQATARAILERISHGAAVHGDLRIENVLLDRTGRLSVVNTGVRLALFPRVTPYSPLPVDAYDGLPPELVESDLSPSAVSDLYSLGCLLWQLLAGRAPFSAADPLAKIRAHRTKSIPDVREIAPETSERFAAWLKQLTAREPHHRPQSFEEAQAAIRDSFRTNRGRLKQFAVQFESAAPRPTFPGGPSPRNRVSTGLLMGAASLMLIAVFWNRSQWGLPSIATVDATTQSKPISPDVPSTDPVGDRTSVPGPPEDVTRPIPAKEPEHRPFPSPDSTGVVRLDQGGDYGSSVITASGPLRILGTGDGTARIRIGRESFRVDAPTVTFENVEFVPDRPTADATSPAACVEIHSRELILRRCVALDRTGAAQARTLLAWFVPNGGAEPTGRLFVENSIFTVPSACIRVKGSISVALFENVYQAGAGPLLSLQGGAVPGFRVPLQLNHCTLRDTGALVAFETPQGVLTSGLLSIQGGGSVIQPLGAEPLVRLPEGVELEAWGKHLEIAAESLFVPVDVEIAGLVPLQGDGLLPLPVEELRVEGLFSSGIRFERGASSSPWADRLLLDDVPLRISDELPGVRPDRLPTVSR